MVARGCSCDLDAPCDDPECIAEREAEMMRQHQVYKALGPQMTPEEWDDVYRDNLGKRLAYPWDLP